MCRAVNKCFLVLINFLFALTSVISVAIGIWLINKLHDSASNKATELDKALHGLKSRLFVLLFISSGCLGVLISLIGFYGAVRESRVALSVYTCSVSCLLITEIVSIVLIAANRAELSRVVTEELLQAVKRDFMPYYTLQAKNSTRSYVVSNIVNLIQISLKCCGVMNYTDYNGTAWHRASPTHNNVPMLVPASCCVISEDRTAEIREFKNWNNLDRYLVNGNRCPTAMVGVYKRGCLSVINDSISGQTKWFILLSCIEIAVQILCMASACCLIKNTHRSAFV